MGVILTQEQLQTLCREWQGVLRLQDWDVLIRLVRERQMSKPFQGECAWTLSRQQAVICLLDPIDYPDDRVGEQDHEVTLVHELMHLHFAPFWTQRGTDHPENIAMELAVERTAQALVGLKRSTLRPKE